MATKEQMEAATKAESKSVDTVPPVDTKGELSTAHAMLKRFRTQVAELPKPWRNWVIESLVATEFEDA